MSELDDVKETRAYQTVSFTPPEPDKRLSVYWASHDKYKRVLGVHGYKFDLQPQECGNLMSDIINTESKKHNIVFQLQKKSPEVNITFPNMKALPLLLVVVIKELV